MTLLIGI